MKTGGLQKEYKDKIIPAMRDKFGYKNISSVPKVIKVVVNCGVGRLREEKQREEVEKYLALITGQKVVPRQAKKAIASFKTRQGMVVGYQVTLRKQRMYDFLGRLISMALPRTRDFQGIEVKSFDKKGNLTIGVKEHIVFPEMIGEDYKFLFGLEITVVTTAHKKEESIALLKLMGFPVR